MKTEVFQVVQSLWDLVMLAMLVLIGIMFHTLHRWQKTQDAAILAIMKTQSGQLDREIARSQKDLAKLEVVK